MSGAKPYPHRDEGSSASRWLSPGLVTSDEVVLRTILDPNHLGAHGVLAPTAMSLADIRSRGWSVDRKQFTSLRRVRSAHRKWKKNNPEIRKFYVLPIPTALIRLPNAKTGLQETVVTDAALWWNPAHAVLLSAVPIGESVARGLRTSLFLRFPPYIEVRDAFGSNDRRGYFKGMRKQLAAILAAPFRYIVRLMSINSWMI
jgi:hypothetical protein